VAAKIAVATSFALPSIALVVVGRRRTDRTALPPAQHVVLVGAYGSPPSR
jgi:hypothetical protein